MTSFFVPKESVTKFVSLDVCIGIAGSSAIVGDVPTWERSVMVPVCSSSEPSPKNFSPSRTFAGVAVRESLST